MPTTGLPFGIDAVRLRATKVTVVKSYYQPWTEWTSEANITSATQCYNCMCSVHLGQHLSGIKSCL